MWGGECLPLVPEGGGALLLGGGCLPLVTEGVPASGPGRGGLPWRGEGCLSLVLRGGGGNRADSPCEQNS